MDHFLIQSLEPRVMWTADPMFSHTVFKIPKLITAGTLDVLGDTAILAGGYAQAANGSTLSGPIKDVYFFDAAKRKWSTSQLPAAFSNRSETVVDDQMLLAGGDGQQGVTDAVNIYTARTHRWSTARLSAARDEIGAVTVGNLAMFAGGSVSSGRSSDVVDIYNGRTHLWSTATLPVARTGIVAASVGRLALFAGGSRKGAMVSDEVDILDTKTGQWSVAHLSSAGFGIAASAGRFALFEHLQNSSILSGPGEVDVYDAAHNTWSTVAMPDYLYNVQTVGPYVVFADGVEPGNGDLGATSHDVHIFNSATGQWTTTQLQGGTSYMGISGVAGRYILFAGGDDDSEKVTGGVYVLDAETGQWSTTSKLSVPREAIDVFAIGKTVYFADGYLDDFDYRITNAVDAYRLE